MRLPPIPIQPAQKQRQAVSNYHTDAAHVPPRRWEMDYGKSAAPLWLNCGLCRFADIRAGTGKRVGMAKKDNGTHTAVTTAPIKGIREA